MKKSNLTGWKDVFAYTFMQTVKGKAYRVVTILFVLAALIVLPVVGILTKPDEAGSDTGSIKKVYVLNETAVKDLDFAGTLGDALPGIVIEHTTENVDALMERIDSEEQESVILHITVGAGGYSLAFIRSGNGTLKTADIEFITPYFVDGFQSGQLSSAGLEDLKIQQIQMQMVPETYRLDADGNRVMDVDSSITMNEYWFVYGILIIAFMVSTMSSQQIAMSVISDKSSKVVEFLLISIRPLALIIGKVTAVLCTVVLQLFCMAAALLLSNQLSAKLLLDGRNMLNDLLPDVILSNFNFVNIILSILVLCLGLLFYAILAGLAGSCVSRMEEANEGMTLYMFVLMAGFYISIIAAAMLSNSGEGPFVTFALLFPLSSPLLLPGAVLIGKANTLLLLAAALLVIGIVVLLFRFTAKVFEMLLLHNGNTIRIKQLFGMSRTTQSSTKK